MKLQKRVLVSIFVLITFTLAFPESSRAAVGDDKPADSLAEAKPKKGGKIKVAVIPQDRERKWTKDIMIASSEDALVGSGRFAVLSRSDLDAVLAEQKLASSELVDPAAAVRIGKALSAQYVVIIRTVSLENKKSGFNVGGFGKTTQTMNCNVQMQLIDTETTQIIESHSYSDKVENSATQVGDLGSSSVEGPGQDAYRKLVEGFTRDFVNRLAASIPIEGMVVLVKGNQVAIDAGGEQAVKSGLEFEVLQEGEPIRDSSGKVLSYDTTKMGTLRVTRVEPKLAWCEVVQTFDPSGTADPNPNPGRIQRDFTVRQVVQVSAAPSGSNNAPGKKGN